MCGGRHRSGGGGGGVVKLVVPEFGGSEVGRVSEDGVE